VIDRTLEVEAKLDSVRAIGLWLADAAREAGLPYEVAFGLDLAVHEAVENVVRHGCGDGATHHIRLSLRTDDRHVEVAIVDDAPPFDPLTLPASAVPQRIEDVVPGGQGVHLMRHFTDEIRYRREEDRNVLTLVRALQPRTEGA
jgi:anti-sigma regulatory factor (Ser/Thr protein kinase)